MQGGDLNAMKLEVLNAELLSSLAIGAQVLIALRPNGQQLTVDQVSGLSAAASIPIASTFSLQLLA